MNASIVIREPAELEALSRRRGRKGIRRVVLALPGPRAELQRAERRINAGLHACGCGVGAFFVLVGVAALATNYVIVQGTTGPLQIGDAAMAAGILMALALVGKIVGIIVAEWRLRATLRQLAGAAWGQAPDPGSSAVG